MGLYPAIVYVLCLISTILILYTDRNLQTDFGSTKPYFIHWYGMVTIAVVEVIAIIILLIRGSRSTLRASAIGSSILAIFLIADIFTYRMAGFNSPQQFATYLFGITRYDNSTSYVPGLYDVLFVLLIITAIASVFSLRKIGKIAGK